MSRLDVDVKSSSRVPPEASVRRLQLSPHPLALMRKLGGQFCTAL